MEIKRLKNGTRLSRNQYEITKYIGSGGFGITYMANHLGYYKHTGFGMEYEKYAKPVSVVIKELFYETYCQRDNATGLVTVTNATKKEEFQKLVKNQLEEGKTVRLLDHPNIVRTRDIFNENDTAYMVMDYVDSIDLDDVINQEGCLTPQRALGYIFQVLDAVDYFHNHAVKKILHLDLKPSNILLEKSKDRPIIIDFGSSLSYDPNKNEVTSRTSQLITGMTKNYAPTEQNDLSNLKKFEASFDTYAIGATLYHLLTGQAPPESGKVSSGFSKLNPPSALQPQNKISKYMDEVILKAISPKYPDRFHTAKAFKTALEKEKEYLQKIKTIETLIAQENYEDAEIRLSEMEISFIPTQKIKNLRIQLKEKQEEEKKRTIYNSFIDKGKMFYETGEYEHAAKYFAYAQEELPHRPEAQRWIEKCQAFLSKKKTPQKETSPQADATPEIPIGKRPKKGGTVKVEGVKKEETTIEETKTQTLKGKTVKIAKTPTPKENAQETAKEKSFLAKYGLVLGGVALLLVGVAIWGIGFGNTTTAEPVTPAVVEDSTATNNTTEVNSPVLSQNENISEAATPTEEPQTEEQEAEIPAWKTNFDKTFAQIRNAESSRKPERSKTKYQTLLNTLPAEATAEKRQVNARIAAMNRAIETERNKEQEEQRKREETQKISRYESQARSYKNESNYVAAISQMKKAQNIAYSSSRNSTINSWKSEGDEKARKLMQRAIKFKIDGNLDDCNSTLKAYYAKIRKYTSNSKILSMIKCNN